MKKNSIKKNFVYNVVYQILLLFVPLICAPYLSRTLGSTGIGTYTYVYSIVYYFMIFTVLGLENYGNRTIAKNRDNKETLSRTFFEIYIFQFVVGVLMLLIYFFMVFLTQKEYQYIFIIQSIFIISSIFDINWFFFGIEKFKATITRNAIVKIISLILIVIFVKNENDLWKYTIIMSVSTLLSQIILWPFLLKEIKFCKVSVSGIAQHIKPNLTLFIPVIAVSIYKMIDKVMLGMLSTVEEVAFYENAEKIIKVPNGLISALGVVMLPRVTNLIANNEDYKVKEYIEKSLQFICFISFPMMFGIICIANDFIPIFYGDGFSETSSVLMLLSLTIPLLAWGNVIRTQFLIPREYDKIYIKSAIYGAIINVIFNIIFIPYYGADGACIGTIVAEFVVAFYQSFSVRKELNFKVYIKNGINFVLKSMIMFLVVYSINYMDIKPLMRIGIQIFIGISIYFLLNAKFIFRILNIKKLILSIKK